MQAQKKRMQYDLQIREQKREDISGRTRAKTTSSRSRKRQRLKRWQKKQGHHH